MLDSITLPNKKYPIQVSELQTKISDLDNIVEHLQLKKQRFILAEIKLKQWKRFVVFRSKDGTEVLPKKNVKYRSDYYIIKEM